VRISISQDNLNKIPYGEQKNVEYICSQLSAGRSALGITEAKWFIRGAGTLVQIINTVFFLPNLSALPVSFFFFPILKTLPKTILSVNVSHISYGMLTIMY
jgi:hypothetical protein